MVRTLEFVKRPTLARVVWEILEAHPAISDVVYQAFLSNRVDSSSNALLSAFGNHENLFAGLVRDNDLNC